MSKFATLNLNKKTTKKVKMPTIQVVGKEKIEKEKIERVISNHYKRINKKIKNIISLKVHVKVHSKGGKRKKWDFRVKLTTTKGNFEAQESDWNLTKALHKVFTNIEKEVKHKLKE